MRLRATAIALGLVLLTLSITPDRLVRAQQQQPTFRNTGAVTVSLFATVTEPGGRLVPDLEEGDFEILDNNRPQPLTVFDNSPRPLSIVLMLDTSFSMSANLARLKDAAEQFLIRLFPKDQAKVGAFNDGVTIGTKFSSDRDILIADMRALDFGNGTRLFDAIDLAVEHLEPIDGRKVVVVFTDGDDTNSKKNRGNVIDRARLKDVMVYAIGFQSEYFDGARVQRSKPDSGLRKIAEETGGGYFELTKANELGPTFTRVAQELHSQYALGFTAPELDNKVHTLTIKLKRPGMIPRARKSYVAERSAQTEGRK